MLKKTKHMSKKNDYYKIAADMGVKSMQKFWLLRELEELTDELPGTLAHGLEHCDVIGLIHIFKIDLKFLNPYYLLPAYDPNFSRLRDNFKSWAYKRKIRGYPDNVTPVMLMEAQIVLNTYVEQSKS